MATAFFPGLGKFRGIFSKAWKFGRGFFQSLEKTAPQATMSVT
jgi:hypothetical protein